MKKIITTALLTTALVTAVTSTLFLDGDSEPREKTTLSIMDGFPHSLVAFFDAVGGSSDLTITRVGKKDCYCSWTTVDNDRFVFHLKSDTISIFKGEEKITEFDSQEQKSASDFIKMLK